LNHFEYTFLNALKERNTFIQLWFIKLIKIWQ